MWVIREVRSGAVVGREEEEGGGGRRGRRGREGEEGEGEGEEAGWAVVYHTTKFTPEGPMHYTKSIVTINKYTAHITPCLLCALARYIHEGQFQKIEKEKTNIHNCALFLFLVNTSTEPIQ